MKNLSILVIIALLGTANVCIASVDCQNVGDMTYCSGADKEV